MEDSVEVTVVAVTEDTADMEVDMEVGMAVAMEDTEEVTVIDPVSQKRNRLTRRTVLLWPALTSSTISHQKLYTVQT